VVSLERANIRHLRPEQIPEPIDLATIDASFISLRLVLPAVQRLLGPNRTILALVKPQFEVGRGNVGKGGVVRDPAQHTQALDDLEAFATAQGLTVRARHESPIQGPAGNREFFLVLATLPTPSAQEYRRGGVASAAHAPRRRREYPVSRARRRGARRRCAYRPR